MENNARPQPAPGGYAVIQKGLLTVWRDMPERFKNLLPFILSFNGPGGSCFPSHTLLAELAGISRRTVIRNTEEMEAVGLFRKSTRSNPARHNANSSCLYSFPDFDDEQVIARIKVQLAKLNSGLAVTLMDVTAKNPSCDTQDVTAKTSSCDTQGVTYPCDTQGVTPPVTLMDVTVTNQLPYQKELKEGASPPVAAATSPMATAGAGGISTAVTTGAAATGINQPLPNNTQNVTTEEDEEPYGSGGAAATAISTPLPNTSPQPKAVPQKPTVSRAAAKSGKAGKELTDHEMVMVLGSIDHMRDYLLFGTVALRAPGQVHPPGPLNWRQFKTAEATTPEAVGIEHWTTQTFMGYFWYAASFYRHRRGVKLTLPDWGRLGSHIKVLLATRTKWQMFEYLMALATHFDLIACGAGNHCQTLQLDEGSIKHASIQSTTIMFTQMTDERKNALATELKAKVEQRELQHYGMNIYYQAA